MIVPVPIDWRVRPRRTAPRRGRRRLPPGTPCAVDHASSIEARPKRSQLEREGRPHRSSERKREPQVSRPYRPGQITTREGRTEDLIEDPPRAVVRAKNPQPAPRQRSRERGGRDDERRESPQVRDDVMATEARRLQRDPGATADDRVEHRKDRGMAATAAEDLIE